MKSYYGFGLVLLAAVCFSTLNVFSIKLNDMEIGTWTQMIVRMGSACLVFSVVNIMLRTVRPRTTRFWVLGLNGILAFLGSVTYLAALELGTAPTKAILLSFMFPIYGVVLGTLLFNEKMTKQKTVAITVGMVGLLLTLEIRSVDGLVEMRLGDVFAFANGYVAAGFIVVGRYTGKSQQSPVWVLSRTYTVALLLVLLYGTGYALAEGLGSASDAVEFAPSFHAILYLVGLAIISTLVPFALLYTGLQFVPASVAGILMLIEPVSVFILSALFLDSSITSWQLLGGAAIVGAGILAVTGTSAHSDAPPEVIILAE